jgi:hypothetical protein
VRMVPGSARNWIAVNAVQQFTIKKDTNYATQQIFFCGNRAMRDCSLHDGLGPVRVGFHAHTGVYDFSTFPDVTGTFTTTGALTISGPSTMHVGLNENGKRAHCVVTLIAPDGVIIIHQQCEFATSPPAGRWEIVSGTGAYANLRGNGPLTMPPPTTEAMTGVIYQ